MTLPHRADAFALLSDPGLALHRIHEGMVSLGFEPDVDNGAVRLGDAHWEVVIRARRDGLAVTLAAPDLSLMRSLKDVLAGRLESFCPEAAETLRWSDEVVAGALPGDLRILAFRRRERLMPGFDRYVFAVEDVSIYLGEAMHVRLLVPPDDGRDAEWPRVKANGGLDWPPALARRVYTIRQASAASGEVVIDVVDHGPGTLAGWTQRVRPGWRIGALGPSGAPPPADAPLLAAADMSALPALARILESARDRRAFCVATAPPEAGDYLSPPPGAEVRLLSPGAGSEALAEAFVAAPFEAGRYFFAAEAKGAQKARAWLDRKAVAKDKRLCAAYWRADG
jgi:ferric-chelate reductase (NADPH)